MLGTGEGAWATPWRKVRLVFPSPGQTPPMPGPGPKGLTPRLPKVPAMPSKALRPQAQPRLMHPWPLLKLPLGLGPHTAPTSLTCSCALAPQTPVRGCTGLLSAPSPPWTWPLSPSKSTARAGPGPSSPALRPSFAPPPPLSPSHGGVLGDPESSGDRGQHRQAHPYALTAAKAFLQPRQPRARLLLPGPAAHCCGPNGGQGVL